MWSDWLLVCLRSEGRGNSLGAGVYFWSRGEGIHEWGSWCDLHFTSDAWAFIQKRVCRIGWRLCEKRIWLRLCWWLLYFLDCLIMSLLYWFPQKDWRFLDWNRKLVLWIFSRQLLYQCFWSLFLLLRFELFLSFWDLFLNNSLFGFSLWLIIFFYNLMQSRLKWGFIRSLFHWTFWLEFGTLLWSILFR